MSGWAVVGVKGGQGVDALAGEGPGEGVEGVLEVGLEGVEEGVLKWVALK